MFNVITVLPTDVASIVVPNESPAKVYLSTLSSTHSLRTSASMLFQIIKILHPEGLDQALELLEKQGQHRFEIIHYFPWHTLTYLDTARIRAVLVHRYSPGRANMMVGLIRRMLKESWRLGLMTAEAYERAADLKPVYVPKHRTSQILEDRHIIDLFNTFFQRGNVGLRDTNMFNLMMLGLTRGEVSQLDRADYDLDSGVLHIRALHPKYRKRERDLQLPLRVQEFMKQWLELRGDAEGPLFPQMVSSHRMSGKIMSGLPRLTPHSIYCILQRHAELAGLSRFRLLDLRMTFLSKLFDQNLDPFSVAQIVGLTSSDYVRVYDPRDEYDKRDAIAQMFSHTPSRN